MNWESLECVHFVFLNRKSDWVLAGMDRVTLFLEGLERGDRCKGGFSNLMYFFFSEDRWEAVKLM